MNASTNPYAGHRYPAEIISHAVWLYFRFTLSFRDIEELLAARGIIGLGSACQGTPLIHPCRLDGGIHAANTPDRHCPDPVCALDGLHP